MFGKWYWEQQRKKERRPYVTAGGRRIREKDLFVPWEPLDEEDV